MIPIGLGLAYAGYVIGLYGFILVRGYDVPFTSMFAQTWPGGAREGGGTPVLPAGSAGAREGGGAPVLPAGG